MSVAINYINYDERMVGANSPDYSDTLNRALQTVVSASGAVGSAFVGFALRPTVAPSIGQFYRATDTVVGASWQTLTTAMLSDLTSATTGITKVGTVNTGVWQASSISTTYTDAKVKTVTGTSNRLTIGGTATDPTFDISTSYVGQATITTVGTIATGTWEGSSIATGFTDAKVVSISGVTNRTTVSGTATVPIVDVSATYVGQGSITTVGTISSGTWAGASIATTYTDAKIKTVTGTVGTITISGTATDPVFTISAAYIGQSTITTLGTVTTGVWNGTAIATANTIAQVIDLTGTANRITIGGTATHPTVDVSTSYVGQATITTLGTIATGVWNGTSITTSFTDAKIKTVTGTSNRLTVGGTSTDPTFDISTAYVGQATITTLGTIATGTWAATAITVDKGGTNLTSYTAGDLVYASGATTLTKLGIGTAAQFLVTNGAATAPAWHTLVTADITDLTTATTGITKIGTIATGVWNGTIVGGTYGGTGINNGASTITIGGNVTVSGAFTTTFTVTANTSVTLPTSGTLVNSAVTSLASLTSVGGAFAISGALTGATSGAFSTTVTAAQLTLSAASSHIVPGATSLSLRNNADSADNLLMTDAGVATIRAGLTVTTGGVTVSAGGLTVSASGVTVTGNSTIAGTLGSLTGITSTGTASFATLTFSVSASSTTAIATPSAYIATTGTLFASTASGAVVMGYGTTGDVTLKNRAGTDVLYIGPNSTLITMAGALNYGGVTLSAAVTGTGNMVLSASPTLSGTVGGALTFSGAHTLSSALTYGGVTLSNAVTGTGNMVLSASPTLTGTVALVNATASGQVILANASSTSLLFFQPSSSARWWQITANIYTASALEFTPSTANGGSTFTTPALKLVGTDNSAIFAGAVSGVTTFATSGAVTHTSDGNVVLLQSATSGNQSSIIRWNKSDGTARFYLGYESANTTFYFENAAGGPMNFVSASSYVFDGAVTATKLDLSANLASTYGLAITDTDASVGTDVMIQFVRNGSNCGSVTTTLGLVTAYNTSSDERLKDLRPLGDVGGMIDAIEVFDGAFLSEMGIRYPMMAAQRAAKVAPWTVKVGGDDPKTDPWAIDYSKFVPMHHKELQSLRRRVAALEGHAKEKGWTLPGSVDSM